MLHLNHLSASLSFSPPCLDSWASGYISEEYCELLHYIKLRAETNRRKERKSREISGKGGIEGKRRLETGGRSRDWRKEKKKRKKKKQKIKELRVGKNLKGGIEGNITGNRIGQLNLYSVS